MEVMQGGQQAAVQVACRGSSRPIKKTVRPGKFFTLQENILEMLKKIGRPAPYMEYPALLVMLELIWVLESVYEISRTDILESISELLLTPIFKFEHQSTLQQFTNAGQKNKYDLSDLLIAYSAKAQGCRAVITFDRKASKFQLFELAR